MEDVTNRLRQLQREQETLESQLRTGSLVANKKRSVDYRAMAPPDKPHAVATPRVAETVEKPSAAPAAPKPSGIDTEEIQTRRKAMLKKYFDAMSDFPDYHERRKQKLAVKPFSFEIREACRARSRRAERFDEYVQSLNEAEQREMEKQFKANPVPTSTFIRKYDRMVQEWANKKEELKQKAYEAEQRQRDKRAANTFAKQEQKQQDRWGQWRNSHPLFKARDVPDHVKKPMWDVLRLREEERMLRIQQRSDALLALSHAPPRMEAAAVADYYEEQYAAEAAGTKSGETQGRQAIADAFHARKRAASEQRHANPNLTFHPTTHPIPDSTYLRDAQDRMQRAAEKLKREAKVTEVKEFDISAGRNTKPEIVAEIERDAVSGVEQRWPYKSTRGPIQRVPPPLPVETAAPPSTAKQTLRTKKVYSAIQRRFLEAEKEKKEAAARRARSAEAAKRIEKYIEPARTQQQDPAKIAEQRQEQLEKAKAAKEAIDAMKARVESRPPIFVEPSYMDRVAKTRASTDEKVTEVLRQHGLGQKTLDSIAAHSAEVSAQSGSGSQAAHSAAQSSVDHVKADADQSVAQPPLQRRGSTSSSSSSDSTSSSSSSSSSSS